MSGSGYWDDQAATFDERPDHGLRDPGVREAWQRLLLAHLPDIDAALTAWLRLLLPGGALVLVEGRWHTGAGIAAADAARAVRAYRGDVSVTILDDPALWGGPVTDERYLLVSRR